MMLFTWFKQRAARRHNAQELYQLAMEQSRRPVFYTGWGIADTMDGRFDLISLHVILMTLRLSALDGEGRKMSQDLFDAMFRRISIDLREVGVGDVGMSKRMQKMMKAFNGRAHAYALALAEDGDAALELAIVRNLFRSEGEAIPPATPKVAGYIRECHAMLESLPLDVFKSAGVQFPDPVRVASATQQEAKEDRAYA